MFNSAEFEIVKSVLLGLSVGFANTVGAAKLEVTYSKQGKNASYVETDFYMWFNITPATFAFKLTKNGNTERHQEQYPRNC